MRIGQHVDSQIDKPKRQRRNVRQLQRTPQILAEEDHAGQPDQWELKTRAPSQNDHGKPKMNQLREIEDQNMGADLSLFQQIQADHSAHRADQIHQKHRQQGIGDKIERQKHMQRDQPLRRIVKQAFCPFSVR